MRGPPDRSIHATLLWGAIMLLVVVTHFLPGNETRTPRIADMRELTAWLEDPGGGRASPWVANSLFVEGRVRDGASVDETIASWDFSHVTTYPVINPVFPLSFRMPESGRAALEAHLDGPWRSESRILAGPSMDAPPAWLLETFKQRGYQFQKNGAMFVFRR